MLTQTKTETKDYPKTPSHPYMAFIIWDMQTLYQGIIVFVMLAIPMIAMLQFQAID